MAVRVDIQVDGVEDLIQNLKRYELKKRGGVMRVLETTALSVDREAKRLLSQPGTGRIYKRGGVMHQASASGQAPATDTGQLRASGHVRRPGPMTREVAFSAGHAPHLEFGTREMAARPFLTPAWQAHKDQFIRNIKAVFKR